MDQFEKRKVLIVDDSEISQILLRAMFEKLNYTVTVADSAALAVRRASETRFDIITMDYHMPEATGLDCIRSLKNGSSSLSESASIVVVTAESDPDTTLQLRLAGADAVLTKPLIFDDLTRALQKSA